MVGPLFTYTRGKRNRSARLLAAEGIGSQASSDVMTIRTEYPFQTLDLLPENADRPALRLWAVYVPEGAEQRTCHAYGLLLIKKPRIPAAPQVAWPFIRHFTERVFAEDRMAVEAEQRAWDEQGEERNHEVFPLILDVRDVLRANGVPLRPRAAAEISTAACDARACDDPAPVPIPDRVMSVPGDRIRGCWSRDTSTARWWRASHC